MAPYELWFSKKPKLSFLKVWGCDAYVKKFQPHKLEPKLEKCVLIGYPKETVSANFGDVSHEFSFSKFRRQPHDKELPSEDEILV